MMKCCEVIASTIKGLGIKKIFGLLGGEVLDLIEFCQKEGIEFITTRHESMAAFMAEVTSQITGVPGVCVATLGPGATNLVNGVANAYLDRQAVLAFAGQLATTSVPYANHQFIELERLFAPITKKTFTLTADNVEEQIKEGYQLAMTPPKGPIFFCLHRDVGQSEILPDQSEVTIDSAKTPDEIDDSLVDEISGMIHRAKKPLVITGIGLDPIKDTKIVRKFVIKNNLPLMTSPKAKGIFPEDNSLFLGTAAGMMADNLLVDLIMKADLIIGLGFDPVESDKIWHKDIKFLSINNYSLKYNEFVPTIEIIGEVSAILRRIIGKDFSSNDWDVTQLDDLKANLVNKLTPQNEPLPGTFSPYAVIKKIRETLPNETILTTDTGAHKLLAGQVWRSFMPLTFFMSNGLSSMGYGLPSVIAAKLAVPEAPTVCLTGDGGFGMVIQDLETAVRLNLPIVLIVLVDHHFCLIDVVQRLRGYSKCGVEFGSIDFPAVAAAFGARGMWLNSLDELPGIFELAFKVDRPTVVAVPVDGSEYHDQL